jgi:CRP-like cAMP-binding protein/TolA-binding protein/CheY-like chemotaxis protein
MSAKVLIAHGNTAHLKQAVADLQGSGFEVTATPDGGDAFARFFEDTPDVVITSEVLSGLSGTSFASMVRSQSPDTPVVLLLEDLNTELPPEAGELIVLQNPLDIAAFCKALPDVAARASLPPAPGEARPSASTPTDVFVLAALKRYQRGSHLLALLDERGVQGLARIAQNQVRGPDEQVIRQGDRGDGFFLIIEGQVRVTLAERADEEVARISAGGFFGEVALMAEQRRSASVWTVGPATLLFFPREAVLPLLKDYPTLRETLSGVALKRTEENLWRVLFADDEVQQSIAELDGMDNDEEHGGGSDVAPSTPEAAAPPAAVVPDQDDSGDVDVDGLDVDGLLASSEHLDGMAAATTTSAAPVGSAHDHGRTDEVVLAPAMDASGDTITSDQRLQLNQAMRKARAEAELWGQETPSVGLKPLPLAEAMRHAGAAAQSWGDPTPAMGIQHILPPKPEPVANRRFALGLVVGLLGGVLSSAAMTWLMNRGDVTSSTVAVGGDQPALEPLTPAARDQEPRPSAHDEPEVAVVARGEAEPGAGALTPTTKPTLDRKELRKAFLGAYKARRYDEALTLGAQLREAFGADWEIDFTLAEATRYSGQLEAAVKAYSTFIEQYPTNIYVDNAQFFLAEVYEKLGDKKSAKALYKKISDKPKSSFKSSAAARLAKL